MRRLRLATVSLAIFLVGPLLAGWVGYRLAVRELRKQPWEVQKFVRKTVEARRQSETMAGAFGLHGIPLEGVERCYFRRPDFEHTTWNGRDVPVPFVGYAPAPGPLPSGHINSQHFRYRRDIDASKPPDTCRIFLIGGSTAYGAGASSNETTVAGYLETMLGGDPDFAGKRFEVITAAASAWCSTHERLLIENRLIEFEPDLVIALSGHNDAYWSGHGENTLWLRAHQDVYHHMLLGSLLSCNFDETLPTSSGGPPVPIRDATRRLLHNATLSQRALQAIGANYCFALQPTLATCRKPRTPREDRMALRVDAKYLSESYACYRATLTDPSNPSWHVADLTSIFDAEAADQDIFIDGCHFGDRGNHLIAWALARHVTPLLTCRRQVGER